MLGRPMPGPERALLVVACALLAVAGVAMFVL